MSSEHQQKMEKRGEGTLAIIMLALIQGRVFYRKVYFIILNVASFVPIKPLRPSFTDISNVVSFHLLVLPTVVMTLDDVLRLCDLR